MALDASKILTIIVLIAIMGFLVYTGWQYNTLAYTLEENKEIVPPISIGLLKGMYYVNALLAILISFYLGYKIFMINSESDNSSVVNTAVLGLLILTVITVLLNIIVCSIVYHYYPESFVGSVLPDSASYLSNSIYFVIILIMLIFYAVYNYTGENAVYIGDQKNYKKLSDFLSKPGKSIVADIDPKVFPVHLEPIQIKKSVFFPNL